MNQSEEIVEKEGNGDSSCESSDNYQVHDHLTGPYEDKKLVSSIMGPIEEKRIQAASEEFNKFLKEALQNSEEPDKLLAEDQSEIRSKAESSVERSYNEDNLIRETVFKLKKIQAEEESLLQNFIHLAKQLDQNDRNSIKRIRDYFEAFNYELAIRSNDKNKLFDKILFKDDQIYKQMKVLENNFKKLEKEYTSLQKFHQVRSLRQTGRFKANPQNLKRVQAEEQMSMNTLSQKFLTKDIYSKRQQDLLLTEKTVNMSNAITYQEGQQQQVANPVKIEQAESNQEVIIDETSVYDWIVDIDLITNVAKEGWKVFLSKKFAEKHSLMATKNYEMPDIKQQQQQHYYGFGEAINNHGWEGATVAVVGLYDKGKTFVLNNLTQSNLPSGKKVNTKGISFKHVNVDAGTHLILVDTAGSYSPVRIVSELSIVEKEATEMFIMDLVFEISDYFICVVNDFTSLDQRYLDRLSRNLQNSPNKTFREIIVIHNLKEVESPEILEHVWSTQVTQIYQNGSIQKTKVAAQNPLNGQLQEKHVLWFKTQFTRHVCLVNDDSYLGISINPWVFSLLRYWLKAVFVPVNRPFSVVDSILSFSKMKLSQYFRTSLQLKIQDTEDMLTKTITTQLEVVDNVRIPQVSIDSSGLIMARPDSFLPATDIIAADQYIIYMDVPGLTKDQILIYRQNVITIIKGNRIKPSFTDEKLEKAERKYGEFALSFKIPEIYERKWSLFTVENGVLTIIYDKDKDDQIVKNKK